MRTTTPPPPLSRRHGERASAHVRLEATQLAAALGEAGPATEAAEAARVTEAEGTASRHAEAGWTAHTTAKEAKATKEVARRPKPPRAAAAPAPETVLVEVPTGVVAHLIGNTRAPCYPIRAPHR